MIKKSLFAAILLVFATGQGVQAQPDNHSDDGGDLVGRWILAGKASIGQRNEDFEIEANVIRMKEDCNSLLLVYTAHSGIITAHPGAQTQLACGSKIHLGNFGWALEHARYQINGNVLILKPFVPDNPTLEFHRVDW